MNEENKNEHDRRFGFDVSCALDFYFNFILEIKSRILWFTAFVFIVVVVVVVFVIVDGRVIFFLYHFFAAVFFGLAQSRLFSASSFVTAKNTLWIVKRGLFLHISLNKLGKKMKLEYELHKMLSTRLAIMFHKIVDLNILWLTVKHNFVLKYFHLTRVKSPQ